MNSTKSPQFALRIVLALAVIVAMSCGNVLAQDAANGQATATVQTALTVAADQNLVFGNVFPGVSSEVLYEDANGAVFTVGGEANAEVTMEFILPTYMSTTTGDRMTIAFASDYCGIDTTGELTAAAFHTADDPNDGFHHENPRDLSSGTLGGAITIGGTSGNTNVFLGGKVIPSINQPAGSYTGDILLMVQYTGN
jgi:hypothetical protein